MARLTLVDSSYFIRTLTLKRDPLEELKLYGDHYDFAICGTVWIEVLRGRTEPRLRDRFDAGFSTMIFLQLPPAGWQAAARLAWELDRAGRTIPATDIMIAATAIHYDAALLTFDNHFLNIPGLDLLGPLD